MLCLAVLGCSHLLFTADTYNAQLTTRLAPHCCAFVEYITVQMATNPATLIKYHAGTFHALIDIWKPCK